MDNKKDKYILKKIETCGLWAFETFEQSDEETNLTKKNSQSQEDAFKLGTGTWDLQNI